MPERPVVATSAATLGRQTLLIYVIHMPLVALLDRVLRDRISEIPAAGQIWFAIVEPVALTDLVAVCLLIEAGLLKIGATWLFDLPRLGTRGKAEPHQVAVLPRQRQSVETMAAPVPSARDAWHPRDGRPDHCTTRVRVRLRME